MNLLIPNYESHRMVKAWPVIDCATIGMIGVKINSRSIAFVAKAVSLVNSYEVIDGLILFANQFLRKQV